MNAADSKVLPAPPNLIRSILAGFDAIANHIGLIFFAIGLDLVLWFGPQVRLAQLGRAYLDWTLRAAQAQSSQLVETLRTNLDAFQEMVVRFNLVSVLHTFPIGIASLMAGRAPASNPLGRPPAWELTSPGALLIGWLVCSLIGILIGTLYFSAVAQAATQGKIDWPAILRAWPNNFLQVFLLCVFWIAVLAVVTIPLSCILPFLLAGGGNVGQFTILIYGAALVWLLFPLVLSPFGIFVHHDKMWPSVMRGLRIARTSMSITLLFALIVLVLSQGLDLLWNIPAETSWFALVGVAGHAFVSASLLAAAFIYYRDIGNYIQQRLKLA
jgi:hypothetical protein